MGGGWGGEKGKLVAPHNGKRKFGAPKWKIEKAIDYFGDAMQLCNQTARTHPRAHGAARNHFPVALAPQVPI